MSINYQGTVFIGSDHAGYALKQAVVKFLADNKISYQDFGTNSVESCDYPTFAHKVCHEVLENKNSLGILICGTGIGMSMAANHIPSIRAALCTHEFHADATKRHNNANVLCLGERITAPGLACNIVKIFLDTPFEGGRHEKRVQMIEKFN